MTATAGHVAMAIENAAAGRWAVQFHPESILTAAGRTGHRVIANVLRLCRRLQARAGSPSVIQNHVDDLEVVHDLREN